MFGQGAKRENEQLKQYVAQLQEQIRSMEQFINSIGGGEVAQLEQVRNQKFHELQQLDAQIRQLNQQWSEIEQHRQSAEITLKAVRQQIASGQEQITLQGFGYYHYENPAEESVQLAAQLESVRTSIKQMVKDKQAVTAVSDFTFNNSSSKGKSFVRKLSKLSLRSYNAEVENAITRLRAGNIETAKKRLEIARNEVCRMGNMINLEIAPRYHSLRTRELELAYEHLEAKKAAKDAERLRRQEQREIQKLNRNLSSSEKSYARKNPTTSTQSASCEPKVVLRKLQSTRKNLAKFERESKM